MKYATTSGVLRWSQGTIQLTRGQSIADDHPLLTERPDLFTDAEPGPSLLAPSPERVERATARPGERRTAPAKKVTPPKRKVGNDSDV